MNLIKFNAVKNLMLALLVAVPAMAHGAKKDRVWESPQLYTSVRGSDLTIGLRCLPQVI